MKQQITLDEAIRAVRDDEAPAAVAEAAGARVWARVAHEAGLDAGSVETIRGCTDVLALFPAYRQGALEGSRALLVRDHLHECATCRATFQQPVGRRLAVLPWRAASRVVKSESRSYRREALAAAAIVAVAIGALAIQRTFLGVPPGSRAAVQSVSGVLQRVAADTTPALQPGEEMAEAEAVRTARGSRAHLKLRDGSIVEMGERAELSVSVRGKDTTVHLQRGSIIVQAAKRRSGQLLVASKDCTVHVTGTVFSVNGGLKGSRVSVIEGEVRVRRGREETRLARGQQWTTSDAMGRVPMRDEIAWSRDVDQHLALLGELQTLRQRWGVLPAPSLRYESRLLGLLPEETVVFASVPNYGQTLADGYRLFQERLRESPVLQEWWANADPERHGGPSLGEVIEKVRGFSDYLGNEVAIAAAAPGSDRHGPRPFLLAEVRRPGLREFLLSEVARLEEQHGGKANLAILDDEALAAESGKRKIFVLLRPDLIAISPDAAALRTLAPGAGAEGGLQRTPFGQRILDAYGEGAGLLFAADLERLSARMRPRDLPRATGFEGLRHLIVERKELFGKSHTEAALAFAGPRSGIASWLAAPGPMGSLDFLSPNAQAAAVFLSKTPSQVLDDILSFVASSDDKGISKLAHLESELELRIREDLADTLGGEFAIALDGPLLPTPAWRLVAEVSDPARLQASLLVLVAKASQAAARAGRPAPRAEAEQVGGETFYSITGGGLPVELHYTFADGYLVAAPTRPLVMQALRTRAGGDSLGRSSAFLALFPAGHRDHVSGLVYQNMAGVFGTLLQMFGSAALTDQQRSSLEAFTGDAQPTLVCVYGESDGIQVAGIGGFLSLDPANLALPMLLERGLPGTARRRAP